MNANKRTNVKMLAAVIGAAGGARNVGRRTADHYDTVDHPPDGGDPLTRRYINSRFTSIRIGYPNGGEVKG